MMKLFASLRSAFQAKFVPVDFSTFRGTGRLDDRWLDK
jgi:hypothetical protein